MKKKEFLAEEEIGAYRVIITESVAIIQTFRKDWQQVFDLETNMGFHIISHFKNQSWKELEALASTLYMSSVLTILDAPFINSLGKLFDEYLKRELKKSKEIVKNTTDETEKEIILQEKHKQELKEVLLNGNN